MIKSLNGKNYITVSHFNGSPYISPGSQSAGMVRYNPNMQNMEVYDGNSWQTLSGYADIGLSGDAEMAIEWAQKKMLEEAKLEELCKQFPTLEKAKANFDMILAMVKHENIKT
jgi:hypothetical protein